MTAPFKKTKTLPDLYLYLHKNGNNLRLELKKNQVTSHRGNNLSIQQNTFSPVRKTSVILLALFLGTFGVHRFYLRQYGKAFLYLLFFWSLIPTLFSLIDVLVFALMSEKTFTAKYGSMPRYCSGCGGSLNIMTLSGLNGTLKDKGYVCRKCLVKINKYNKGLAQNISKKYDTPAVRNIIATSVKKTKVPANATEETLKKYIEEARQQRQKRRAALNEQQSLIKNLERRLCGNAATTPGTTDALQKEITQAQKYLHDLSDQYANAQLFITIESDDVFKKSYEALKEAYEALLQAKGIQNIGSEKNPAATPSKEALFTMESADFIRSEYKAFHLKQADGIHWYLYPAFILSISNNVLHLISWQELRLDFSKKIEQQSATPYGILAFSTKSGIQAAYSVRPLSLAERFSEVFQKYLSLHTAKRRSPKKQPTDSESLKDDKHFPHSYYTLLKDFSLSLSAVTKKLQTNSSATQHLSARSLTVSPALFITHCVCYDIVQITRMLLPKTFAAKSLEATGFILIFTSLSPDKQNRFLDKDYNTLAREHKKGFYKNKAQALIASEHMNHRDNPLKVTVQKTENDKVSESFPLDNNLSLPAFLKITGNPLSEEYATILYRYATIIAKANNVVSKAEEKVLQDIYQRTHHPIPEEQNETLLSSKNGNDLSLDDILRELHSLIGLNTVKAEISSLINFIKIQKAREQSGLKSSSLSYHIVFTGNPGTGKTTVARLIARIYKHLGILSEGHLVETDRSGLVAEYVGQTAVKVHKTVDSAINGILFIDEAYALAGKNKDDFGKEAVAALIKRMEDNRDKLVVILAGYTQEMTDFINTNPGFQSRFNRYIRFPDYTAEELQAIFTSKCQHLEYHLTEKAAIKLQTVFENAYTTRGPSFGNGRFVRNIFEKTLERQANRIVQQPHLTQDILKTITEEDIAVS